MTYYQHINGRLEPIADADCMAHTEAYCDYLDAEERIAILYSDKRLCGLEPQSRLEMVRAHPEIPWYAVAIDDAQHVAELSKAQLKKLQKMLEVTNG
jgi:hypothetical protein